MLNDEERQLGQRLRAAADRIAVPAGARRPPPRAPAPAIASGSILSIPDGEVLVQETPESEIRPGEDGETLKAGMTVESKGDARAVLTFEDGSTLELEPGSKGALAA